MQATVQMQEFVIVMTVTTRLASRNLHNGVYTLQKVPAILICTSVVHEFRPTLYSPQDSTGNAQSRPIHVLCL